MTGGERKTMPDREKVIEGLEKLRKDLGYGLPDRSNVVMEYLNSLTDALVLLKEQTARVMTLEEVKAFDWEYCYLEAERLQGKEYRKTCGDYALTCVTWPCIASMRIQHGDDSYGKKWRCWSAKPTDEQRQEEKWE